MVPDLAKPKFWARSIVAIGEVMADLAHPVPDVCKRSVPSLTTEDTDFFAATLFELASAFRPMAWKINHERHPLDKWWQLRSYVTGEHEERAVGKIVYIEDAILGRRQVRGIGQLVGITHEPTGRRLYDDDDKGPPRLLRVFELKLFNGETQNWTNASFGVVPTIRTIEMFRDIMRRV